MIATKNIFLFYSLLYCVTSYTFKFVHYKNDADDGSLHTNFMHEVNATFHPDIFVETGTYRGYTARTAASIFKEVFTVEYSESLYNRAQKLLEPYSNVRIYHDSSPDMIRRIAPQLNGHTFFWLDAHYSGGETVLSNSNERDADAVTPVRHELRAIKESGITDCTIAIDDIRGFGTVINGVEYLGCWAYPSLQEIEVLAREINPNFVCALVGDILLIYDAMRFSPTLSPIVQVCTATRLYDGSNLTDDSLIACENVIMQASDDEKACITNLYLRMTPCKDPLFWHDLWFGLVSMGSQSWNEALAALEKVSNRYETLTKHKEVVNRHIPYQHPRIANYIAQARAELISFENLFADL